MKSEASMLASLSSSKAICELPKLDIFLPEDDVSPVKAKVRPQDKDFMQLRDVGHELYRAQLGSVTAAVAGESVTTENNQLDLLAIMDAADEV